MAAKRTVITGEVEGTSYRAHFDGDPSPEQRKALDEIVRETGRIIRPDNIKLPRGMGFNLRHSKGES